MILRLLLYLLPVWIIGYCIVELIWQDDDRAFIIKIILGVAIGQGVDACIRFLLIVIFGSASIFSSLVVWLICLGILSLTIGLSIQRHKKIPKVPQKISIIDAAHLFIGIILVSGLMVVFFLLMQTRPFGTFDAYAIWNLKARFLFFNPDDWALAVSPDLFWKTHPDYPLLIPLNVLRLWQSVNQDTPRAAQLIAATYSVGVVAFTLAYVHYIYDRKAALIGGFVLLSAPAIIFTGTAQTADIPLSFYMLTSGAMLFSASRKNAPRLMVLAGLLGGLAAWTKNEGAIYLIILTFLMTLFFRKKSWLLPFAAGVALPLITVAIFKFFYAPPGDMVLAAPLNSTLANLVNIDRHFVIIKAVINNIGHVGGLSVPVIMCLGVALVTAPKLPTDERKTHNILWLLVCLVMLSYYGVYLLTPHPLEWHIRYSMDRLVWQVFPLVLLLVALRFETSIRIR